LLRAADQQRLDDLALVVTPGAAEFGPVGEQLGVAIERQR
jgi:hypothetical protein